MCSLNVNFIKNLKNLIVYNFFFETYHLVRESCYLIIITAVKKPHLNIFISRGDLKDDTGLLGHSV